MKAAARRIGKLERKFTPKQRLFCVLGTPENQALVASGFLPDPPQTTATPASSRAKHPLRRLGKRDLVVFMLAAEMAL